MKYGIVTPLGDMIMWSTNMGDGEGTYVSSIEFYKHA
jgi:hypothetical protein